MVKGGSVRHALTRLNVGLRLRVNSLTSYNATTTSTLLPRVNGCISEVCLRVGVT